MPFCAAHTRNFKEKTKIYFLFGVVGIYIFGVIFSPSMLLATGFFIMLLALMSLEKLDGSKILLILSPVITYPLFVMLFVYLYSMLPTFQFEICFILFALIYGLLLSNFHSWIRPKMKWPLVISLIIICVFTFTYSSIAKNCHEISGSEKGVTQVEITNCRFYNLYQTSYYSGKFSGLYGAIVDVATHGPIFVSAILILICIFPRKNMLCSRVSVDR